MPMTELTGRAITVYGQQEVVKDLIAARLAAGGTILFEADVVRLDGLDSSAPVVRYRRDGREEELRCDFVAGCDGFHGVSRGAVPEGVLTSYERAYPFAWLGVLADAPRRRWRSSSTPTTTGVSPSTACAPPRSPGSTCRSPPTRISPPGRTTRIWAELRARLETVPGWSLTEGPVLEKVHHPDAQLRGGADAVGRLFLAGDAAHIVPPTGAKGMNLALADVALLGDAFAAWYGHGRTDLLDGYSATALRRVWRAQHFSWWMTSMLHRLAHDDPYEAKLQTATCGTPPPPAPMRRVWPRTTWACPRSDHLGPAPAQAQPPTWPPRDTPCRPGAGGSDATTTQRRSTHS